MLLIGILTLLSPVKSVESDESAVKIFTASTSIKNSMGHERLSTPAFINAEYTQTFKNLTIEKYALNVKIKIADHEYFSTDYTYLEFSPIEIIFETKNVSRGSFLRNCTMVKYPITRERKNMQNMEKEDCQGYFNFETAKSDNFGQFIERLNSIKISYHKKRHNVTRAVEMKNEDGTKSIQFVTFEVENYQNYFEFGSIEKFDPISAGVFYLVLYFLCLIPGIKAIVSITKKINIYEKNGNVEALKDLQIPSAIHSIFYEIALIHFYSYSLENRNYELSSIFTSQGVLAMSRMCNSVYIGLIVEIIFKIAILLKLVKGLLLEKIYDYRPLFIPISLLVSSVMSLYIIFEREDWIFMVVVINIFIKVIDNAYFDRINLKFNDSDCLTYGKLPLLGYFYCCYDNVFMTTGQINEVFVFSFVPLVVGFVLSLNQYWSDGRFMGSEHRNEGSTSNRNRSTIIYMDRGGGTQAIECSQSGGNAVVLYSEF